MATTGSNRPFIIGNDDLKPVVIALVGATSAGKSTFANLVSGSHLAVSDSLKSCTNSVQVSEPFNISGHSVTLIDTPGFDDTTLSDTDVLKMIAGYMATTYEAGFKLSGLIYMHRITDRRVGGMSRKNFSMLRKLCGDDTLKNVAIVTTMWDQESSISEGVARETELMTDDLFFKPVLDKGAQMLRHDHGLESARDIVSRFITKTPMAMQIRRELVEDRKLLEDTAAGVEVQGSPAALIEEHKREMRALREDLRMAIRERREETRQELEDERRKLENVIATMQKERAVLFLEHEKEKKRADEEIQKLKDEAREQQKRVDALQKRMYMEHSKFRGEFFGRMAQISDDLLRVKNWTECPEFSEIPDS